MLCRQCNCTRHSLLDTLLNTRCSLSLCSLLSLSFSPATSLATSPSPFSQAKQLRVASVRLGFRTRLETRLWLCLGSHHTPPCEYETPSSPSPNSCARSCSCTLSLTHSLSLSLSHLCCLLFELSLWHNCARIIPKHSHTHAHTLSHTFTHTHTLLHTHTWIHSHSNWHSRSLRKRHLKKNWKFTIEGSTKIGNSFTHTRTHTHRNTSTLV